MGLLQDFGLAPVSADDTSVAALDNGTAFELLGARLRRDYLNNQRERARQLEQAERKALYKDAGTALIDKKIDAMFADDETRRLRKAVAKCARFDNITRRTINEISTVYGKDATRRVSDPADDLRYQALLSATRHGEVMRRANRWLNLCNDVLIWFRVRSLGGRPPQPVTEVITPNQFWAIAHPDDPTFAIGFIIALYDTCKDRPTGAAAQRPGFAVWSDSERFMMTNEGKILGDTYTSNPFGIVPGVFLHREPPDGGLFDATSGADLKDGHLMSWFENTLLIKESKSVSKQNVWTGDMAALPSGQSQETEVDLIGPEGTTFQQIDRGVDLRQFRETSDHIGDRVMGNHGIPPSVRNHEGASSGYEQELRERRLRELRAEQIVIFRNAERELAAIQSIVLEQAMPEFAFSTDGWSIDFPEVQTLLSPDQELDVFERARKLGLTSTIKYLRKTNPDLMSDEDASMVLAENIADELFRNTAMRPLAEINGSATQALDDARSAIDNGMDGLEAQRGRAMPQ